MKKEEKRHRGPAHAAKSNVYMMRMVWEADPGRVVISFLSYFIGFGFWVFETVVFMRYLFGAEDLNRSFAEVAVFLALTVAAWMLSQLFSAWMAEWYNPLSDQKLIEKMNLRLFRKAANVELQCYEDEEYYSQYTKAASEAVERCTGAVDESARFCASVLASTAVAVNLFTIQPLIGLAALVPMAVNVITGLVQGQAEYDRRMDYVPFERRQDYVNRTVYLQKYAKDMRLTDIFEVMTRTYDRAMEGHIGVTKRYWKRLAGFTVLRDSFVYPIFFEGIWLLGAYMAMVSRTMTVSDFVVVANSAVSSTGMLINLTGSLVSIFSNALYADNLHAFLDYHEKIPEDQPGLPAPAEVETLELHGVSFRYRPDAEEVLHRITLTLRAGEVVSLVGHNGSGKSTLVKLIMRLYDPTEGTILLNGVDIRRYNLREYRALIGSTFQDFQIFSMSVADNVLMGNEVEGDPRQAARRALEESGVYSAIEALPHGMDTTLTREFDDQGAMLSGGEEQKVAIARAFAKKSRILILDEPSSALDPVAEYHMYRNFLHLCRKGEKKISLFISHRLSSAAVADRVFLLQEGRIAEEGTHTELMKKKGAYADLFRKQAENYLVEVRGE